MTTVDSNGALALRSPREAVVAIGEVWQRHRVYDDLWRVDLETGAAARLTDGARATDPAVGPDGETLVYVRRTGGGTMALVRRPLAGGEEEVLYARRDAQVYAPARVPRRPPRRLRAAPGRAARPGASGRTARSGG